MTPPNTPALIAARREGYVEAKHQEFESLYGENKCSAWFINQWTLEAERTYPTPAPTVWRETPDSFGQRYRRRDGVWEVSRDQGKSWDTSEFATDAFVRALHQCLTEPEVTG